MRLMVATSILKGWLAFVSAMGLWALYDSWKVGLPSGARVVFAAILALSYGALLWYMPSPAWSARVKGTRQRPEGRS